MTPDVKGLLTGAGRTEPRAVAGAHLGRRTADSPFAVLLASSATAPAERAAPAPGDGERPVLDLAALAAAGTTPAPRLAGQEAPALGTAPATAVATGEVAAAARPSGEHAGRRAAPVEPTTAHDGAVARAAALATVTLDPTSTSTARAGTVPPGEVPPIAIARPEAATATDRIGPPSEPLAADAHGAARRQPVARASGRQPVAGAPPVGTPSLPSQGTAAPAAPSSADGAAPAPSTLTRSFGTPPLALEGRARKTVASEDEQEATESSLQPTSAPVPAPAGTGVIIPPPAHPAAAAPTVTRDARTAARQASPADPAQPARQAQRVQDTAAARPQRRARPLHNDVDMGEAASDDRHVPQAEGLESPAPATAAATDLTPAPARTPATATRLTAPISAPTPSTHAVAPATDQASSLAQAPARHAATPVAAAAAEQHGEPAWRAASRPSAPAAPATAAQGAPIASVAPEQASPQQASPQQTARRDDRRAAPAEVAPSRVAAHVRPAAARAEAPSGAPRPAPPAQSPAATGQVMARELGTSARLTQASRAGQSLREGAPHRSARPGPPAEAAPQAPPQALAQAAPPSPEPTVKAAAPRGAPVLPPEPPQTQLGGTILPHTAHLRLESEALGDLALHLRVRDGVAHVRVEGEQAAQLAGRGQELQRALAAEGLKLGHLEVERPAVPAAPTGNPAHGAADQGAPQGERGRPERDEPAAGQRASAAPGRRPSGRATAHHVEA